MPQNLPPTCEIRSWVVFGPGYWRGALYTPADCERVPPNFRRLRGYINPVVKLGHDKDQLLSERLKKSLGFLNLGDFAAVTPVGGGRFSVTLTNVPTAVGAEINAGRIRSGSVELIPFVADPDDPAKKIQGPIITGVALLGEEHPAVKGFAPPRAVFADGTPVPPATDPTPWLEAMSAVARDVMSAGFSDAYDPTPRTYRLNGRDYPLTAVCFSEFTPMGLTPEFLKSLGLSEDQISQIMAQSGGAAGTPPADGGTDAPPPVPSAPPPGGGKDMASAAMPGPAATPVPDKGQMAADDQTMMSAKYSELEKRFSAVEAKLSDAQKTADMKCAAAYSDRVERVLTENARRIAPNTRSKHKKDGMEALTKSYFSDEIKGDQEKAFAAWKAFIESMPESDKFSAAVEDAAPKDGKRTLSPLQQAILNSRAMRTQAPTLRQRLLDAARPSAN